ncbi:ABC1 kinase family protein [Mycobacteroides chelonae]|uniref:ABC transporter n=1 Tax=Mycobacteroides chelonae TaxID=1774 RepID=A0A1S1M426_MYCCH|nr:AarF/ABC1/UbiB kinase family protein [Mycobacteroides chelonae]OHU63391.1 ABC transporter [Mycobacteroides chelonae]OHU79389.1 ABC transporter [Mycobacteroides chelonae]QQG89599.1 AarF/ABC1/UbiB kinase family protein [Mycobacteroides chelonae]QQG94414.1 AarF/ABC1/UbiB kinase family protein [Mycobacteroides chelonae]
MPDQHRGKVVPLFSRRATDASARRIPIPTPVRNAKLAKLPAAYAARRVGGAGKRLLGRSAEEIGRDIQLRTAQHIFEVLGELRGGAQKLGQILALTELTLPSGLAEPYRTALSKLQDSGPSMLPSLVHDTMAANMGENWRQYFSTFDSSRAAAASIGQVHRAVWHDGTVVAVKVMYPGVREALLNELRLLRSMAPMAGVVFPAADVRTAIDALCDYVGEELDFQQEAHYQRAFAAGYADDPDFLVPNVIEQQRDVLISEWVDAVPLNELIRTAPQEARDRLGTQILRFVTSSYERTGYLYGDPHPGNFRRLPDGRLGVVDFGACSPYPAGFFALAHDIGEAILNGGDDELNSALRQHGFVVPGQELDIEAITASIAPFRELFISPAVHLNRAWFIQQVNSLTEPRLSNVARQMTVPGELIPSTRALILLFGALSQLGCTVSFRDEIVSGWPGLAEVLHRYQQRTESVAPVSQRSSPN